MPWGSVPQLLAKPPAWHHPFLAPAQPQAAMAAPWGHIPCLLMGFRAASWAHAEMLAAAWWTPALAWQQSRSPRVYRASLLVRYAEGRPFWSCLTPPLPLVVSLSRIMKDPNVFPGLSSCRSASFLLIPLKNHLQQEQSKQRPLLGARKPRLAQAGAISPGRWGHGV